MKEVKEEKASDVVDKITSAWKDLVESPRKDSYASVVMQFKDVCKKLQKFLVYVQTTILNTVKEKFVRAWTYKVLILGCRTTNIVESAHRKLIFFRSSVGDLAWCWDEIDKMLAIQLLEIQASFGRSRTILEHIYKDNFLYTELEGCVSRTRLCFTFEEAKRFKTFNIAKKYYDCVIKTSYELPCACILSMKIKKLPIQLDDINPHWQRFPICEEEVDDDFSVMEEWNDIQERLKKVPCKMKLNIKEVMRQLEFPQDTILSQPPRKVVTKGAPKRVSSTPKESSTG